jgi:hypothetical protein
MKLDPEYAYQLCMKYTLCKSGITKYIEGVIQGYSK